jgi:signal transduction histidine kinase
MAPTKALDFEALHGIYDAVAGDFGEVFIERLIYSVSKIQNAKFVAITRGEGAPIDRVSSVYAWDNGTFRSDVSYCLEGSPCEFVFRGQEIVIPFNLAARFPDEDGFESYVGIPLMSSDGQVSGHLIMLSASKLENADAVVSILRIFAKRAEVELQRIDHEDERQKLVDDVKSRSDRLKSLYKAAHERNLFKTRLVGLIAHDLRGSLAAISAQTELAQAILQRDAPGSTAKVLRACDKITRNVDRMSGQIEATLARVRTECKALTPDFTKSDLVEIAQSVLDANKVEAERKMIALSFLAPQSLFAWFDENLIFPAIDNLLTNAIKYTHRGGSVTLEVLICSEGEVTVAVTDTGQGLSREDCARAFQPFETLTAVPTDGESSTGMGLFNVKAVAEAHGGRVTAQSDGVGFGSRFSITFPQLAHSIK